MLITTFYLQLGQQKPIKLAQTMFNVMKIIINREYILHSNNLCKYRSNADLPMFCLNIKTIYPVYTVKHLKCRQAQSTHIVPLQCRRARFYVKMEYLYCFVTEF